MYRNVVRQYPLLTAAVEAACDQQGGPIAYPVPVLMPEMEQSLRSYEY